MEEVEPRIVEAVFTSGNTGGMKKSPLGKLIEQAMGRAVQDAYDRGITDPVKIRELMMDARQDMKERYAKALASAGNLAG